MPNLKKYSGGNFFAAYLRTTIASIVFRKSIFINNESHSKIIKIALLTPNLGEGIDDIKSLKTSELAWSILPKENNKKDIFYKIIYENEVLSPWKLIKKI